MAAPIRLNVGDITLTRVLYVDALIPPDLVGLSVDDIRSVAWRDDRWATDDDVRVGAAAWVVSSGDRHVVMDPFLNADDIFHDAASTTAHQEAIAAAFSAAGIALDAVTDVVATHIEGLGLYAVRDGDGWRPFFPTARIRIGDSALTHFRSAERYDWASDVWSHLIDAGLVDTYLDGEEIVPGMSMQHTGAHNPGHHVAHFHGTNGVEVTNVGHLAVVPLHLATGPCPNQHIDAESAWQQLHTIAADGRILIGPLWPSPGAGRWLDDHFVPLSPSTLVLSSDFCA